MREIDFLNACYAVDGEDSAWSRRVCSTAAAVLSEPNVACYMFEVASDGQLHVSPPTMTEPAAEIAERHGLGPAAPLQVYNSDPRARAFLRPILEGPSSTVGTVSELPEWLAGLTRRCFPGFAEDSVGLFAKASRDSGVALGSLSRKLVSLSPGRRTHLTRLAEHLAAGRAIRDQLRKSDAPEERHAAAVFSGQGRLLHADEVASNPAIRSQIVDAMARMDRARCRRKRVGPEEAPAEWQAFVAGRYTLVDSYDAAGRRYVLAMRTRSQRLALTQRESAIVRHAAAGLSNKEIGARMGIATSTVSVHLGSAMRKLGCENRTELIKLMASAGGP